MDSVFTNILLSIIGFVGVISTKQLIAMGKDINSLKIDIAILLTKQKNLEDAHTELKESLQK